DGQRVAARGVPVARRVPSPDPGTGNGDREEEHGVDSERATAGEGSSREGWRGALRRALAFDPGLQRTRLAGGTTLAVAVALGITVPVARGAGQPVTLAMLATVVAMISSTTLAGVPRAARPATVALAWGVALLAAGAGVALAPHPLASYAGFVLGMALSAW